MSLTFFYSSRYCPFKGDVYGPGDRARLGGRAGVPPPRPGRHAGTAGRGGRRPGRSFLPGRHWPSASGRGERIGLKRKFPCEKKEYLEKVSPENVGEIRQIIR
jgi:hypothetical protein